MHHILLVEDELDLSEIACTHLRHAGHAVDTAFTRRQAEDYLEKKEYDLILLDIMLPDASGIELCHTIREKCVCPIIFMSCLGDGDTIISALRGGGDDYMVKPVNYQELLARADAVIRRAKSAWKEQGNMRVFRSFSIDTVHHRLIRDGEKIELSSIEYSLLLYMVDHPNTLLLYQNLYEHVWDSDSLGDFRTVMVHISNLRKKLDPDHRNLISTVRGAGYIFNDL